MSPRKKNPPSPSAPDPEAPKNPKRVIAEKRAALEALERAQSEAYRIHRAADDKLRAARDEIRELEEAEFRQCAEVVIEILTSEKGKSLLGFLAPNHFLTTCSDKVRNNEGKCSRCVLLEAVSTQWWDDDYQVDLHITKKD